MEFLEQIGNDIRFEFGGRGVLEGRQQKDDATGVYQPSIFQRAIGISGEQLNNAGDVLEERGIKKKFKSAQEAEGVEYVPGLSAGQQQKRLTDGQRASGNKAFYEGPQGKMMRHNMEQGVLQQKNANTTFP